MNRRLCNLLNELEENMYQSGGTFPSLKRLTSLLGLLLLALSLPTPSGLAAGSPAPAATVPTLGVLQQWSLVAPQPGALDQFGFAVAIDGTTAVVGARNADPDLGAGVLRNAGEAFVYTYDGKTWVLDTRLVARNASPGDTFGVSVAIHAGTIVVGATGVDLKDESQKGDLIENAGAAYVFTRNGGTWTQQAKLTASDYTEEDSFGSEVAIYKDTVVVAAQTKDLLPLVDVGAAYVYRHHGGKVWAQQAKLLPSNPSPFDYFGSSLAIYSDQIAVGAIQFNPLGQSGPGAVFLFGCDGVNWPQRARLEAEDGRPGDAFGNSVALFGPTLVVGADHADPLLNGRRVTSAGAAYVFTGQGSDWKQTTALSPDYAMAFDQFGQAVGIYLDTIVVGATGATQAGNRAAGAVYVFKKSAGDWNMQTRVVTDPAGEDDLFGRSVAIDRDWFIAGATGRAPAGQPQAGQVFLNLLGPVQLPSTGFAPGVRTNLPARPTGLVYQEYAAMTLEIPLLGQELDIVGVPKSGDGWDVRWLGAQAGYLEGTAFPSWPGNTALAAHTTLSNGGPGPFARLSALRWGDQLVLHAWGQRYIYAVRANALVAPADLDVLKHEDLDWITLISCDGYDQSAGEYAWRRVVRAVLVEVIE
jgi:LPXTG-site transpeptidase (sortase) family protein